MTSFFQAFNQLHKFARHHGVEPDDVEVVFRVRGIDRALQFDAGIDRDLSTLSPKLVDERRAKGSKLMGIKFSVEEVK